VHFKRKVLNTVSTKDKAEVGEEFKALFPVEHTDMTPLAAYFTYLRFPENVRRMIYSTNWVERLNRCYKRTCSCAERCLLPLPWFIFWALLPRRKRKGRMQDAFRIFGSGKSSKTTNKNQHHKFPSGLGYPKPEEKDEGESYTLFLVLP